MTMHSLQKDIVEEFAKMRQTHTVDRDLMPSIRTALSSYGKRPPNLINMLVK